MPIDESPIPLLPKISPISDTQIQDGIVHLENGNILKVYNDLLEFNESRELYEKLEGVPELLSYYVKPITWNLSELSCEMEKFGESISNRLRSKKPLEGEDDKLFYLDDNFDEVAYWLRDVLEKLHKNDLYHGDILGNGNFHIGNIVCKLVDGNWVYKLIDFGDKLGKAKDSHIIYGVDKTELDLMSGKIKEEILLKKLFTNEGKYTSEMVLFKNSMNLKEKARRKRNNKHHKKRTRESIDSASPSPKKSRLFISPPTSPFRSSTGSPFISTPPKPPTSRLLFESPLSPRRSPLLRSPTGSPFSLPSLSLSRS